MKQREIKFRSWDKKGKKMIIQNSLMSYSEFMIDPLGAIIYYREPGVVKNDSWVLLQFTGLLDKNDVEIYDKDIVSVVDDDKFYIKDGNYPVEWNEGMAGWGVTWEHGRIALAVLELEVIGNIYENKELLK